MRSIVEIEDSLKRIENVGITSDFIKGFLRAYDIPNATITRTDFSNASLLKGIQIGLQALFVVTDDNLSSALAKAKGLKKRVPRFAVAMDNNNILAEDTILDESIFFPISEVSTRADFFLPLIGREKNTVTVSERVDTKIGARMARLYNSIMMSNPGVTGNTVMAFLVGLITIFATNSAEGICKTGLLHEFIDTHTEENGSNFYECLVKIMNGVSGKTNAYPEINMVDSRLFSAQTIPLKFDSGMRENIIELASMPWMEAQTDYLGQVLQSIIVDDSTSITDNYTTSENVNKVINPLFMDDLNIKFNDCGRDTDKLLALRDEILNMWIFDPACGAGEFLVTAWDALNELLVKIGERLDNVMLFPANHLSGITCSTKSQEVANLNLYFMALRWSIKDAVSCLFGGIITAKSLLLDWNTVCKPDGKVYVLGNWPYAGARKMTEEQKKEVNAVFGSERGCGDVDYAGAYFLKAVQYIKDKNGEIAFVTTNSLTQGKQVVQLWPKIKSNGVHIRFAYQAFKWSNDARNKTTVTVVILGVCRDSDKRNAFLYTVDAEHTHVKRLVKNISPYLVPGDQMIKELRKPISKALPKMVKGNMPYGAEYFSFTPEEKAEAVERYPEIEKYMKTWIGADEMLGGKERWCLWIRDDEVADARKIPIINERLSKIKASRLAKTDKTAQKLAARPHSFREQNETHTHSIALPQLSSENYALIPIDIYGPETILTNLAFVIYDEDEWAFGVVASTMHNVWIRTVCGGFETRIRYSESLGYNTFPFPNVTDVQKQEIRACVEGIMTAREEDFGKSLGAMYKKGQMSETLQQAHMRLDQVIDRCYRKEPFLDEQERIYYLFDMYEKMKGAK